MKLIPPDVNDRTLTLVRGIGFDTIHYPNRPAIDAERAAYKKVDP